VRVRGRQNELEIAMEHTFSQDWVPLWTALAASAAIVTALVRLYTRTLLFGLSAPKRTEGYYVCEARLKSPSILMIVVENIGRDIAHDVKFFPSKPIPAQAWAIEFKKPLQRQTLSTGPLISGIPALVLTTAAQSLGAIWADFRKQWERTHLGSLHISPRTANVFWGDAS